jgi:uncharacterized protein
MTEVMPQEIAVWYVIPAIRKELSKELLKRGIAQKGIASILGVTESAVSQYLKSKRAIGMRFTKEEKKRISEAADKIMKTKKGARKQIYMLSNDLMGSKVVCRIHMRQDKSLHKGCKICSR